MRGRTAVAAVGPAVALLVIQQVLFPAPAGIVARGVVVGLLAALVALGMALVHRSHGVVNFAQADLGAVPAVVTVLLVVRSGWPWLGAVAVGLLLAAALGASLEVTVVRRLTARSPLVATVATIGVAQALVGAAALLPRLWGERLVTERLPAPFSASLTIGDVTFDGSSVLAVVLVPLAAGALAAFLGRTRAGLAVRAAADAPARAATLGIPVPRLRALVWVAAAVLAFMATVLRAGVLGLPLGTGLTLGILLRSLAALVVGQRGGLPGVAAAATAIGVLEQGVAWGDWRVLPVPEAGAGPQLVDPVLAVAVLVALGLAGLGRRGGTGAVALLGAPPPRRQPGRSVAPAAVFVSVALVVAPHLLDAEHSLRGSVALLYAVLGLSVVIVTGWSGQLSLAQVAFFGLGAAVGAGATGSWDLDLSLAVVVAAAAGAAAAAAVGLPVVRLRGLGLAVASLAAALAASAYLLDVRFFGWLPRGRVDRPPLLGRVHLDSPTRIWYVALGALALGMVALAGVRASRPGRAIVAVRENERAAAAYGIDPFRTRLIAFAAGGAVAAFAGAVFVHQQQSFDLGPYVPLQNLAIVAMVVIGGVTSLTGALVGALYLEGADWLLPGSWRSIATGAGLVAVLLLAPGGLVSLPAAWRRPARRPNLAAPPGSAGGGGPPGGATSVGEVPAAGLVVRGLTGGRAGTTALFGVDIDAAPGEVVAVLGPNGAGKSTLLRAIAGLADTTAGSVVVEGVPLTGMAAHRVAAAGVALVPGGEAVFASLSVDDHLRLAGWSTPGGAGATTGAPARFPVLERRRGSRAGDLSGGEQQLLALAMAATTRARVLLVDELSSGLAPAVVARELEPLVRAWRQRGVAVVLVEQSVPVALRLADRVVVLDKGEVRFSGPAAELRDDPGRLARVLLNRGAPTHPAGAGGAAPTVTIPTPARPPSTPALEVVAVTRRFGGVVALDGVTLTVTTGELVGIVGPNGAGKTTLFDVVGGFVRPDAGRVVLHGADVTQWSAARRAGQGLGRSFQDARLFPALTVADVLAIAQDRWIEPRDLLAAAAHLPAVRRAEQRVRLRTAEIAGLFGLVGWLDTPVGSLPAGVRRAVDLAAVAAHRPVVALLDEPSSGVSSAEAAALAPRLRALRDGLDATVLVIEHDLPLVSAVADRLVVLDRGRVLADGPPDEVLAEPEVVAAYGGGAAVGNMP